MPNNKIPDRWEAYSKIGKVICGTKIMPIKVPLKESLTASLPPEDGFSPASLLDLLKSSKLKLGAVVDLTYTTKYYNSQFFPENGINFKKVYTKGHVIPDNKTYSQFASAIKEVEKDGEVICVHCTHGLNRSGYLICRYMIEVLNMEPQHAISLFESARGHKMERQNYIDDLMRRLPGVCTSHEIDEEEPLDEDHSRNHQRPEHRMNGFNGQRGDDREWPMRDHQRQRGRGRGYQSHHAHQYQDGSNWSHNRHHRREDIEYNRKGGHSDYHSNGGGFGHNRRGTDEVGSAPGGHSAASYFSNYNRDGLFAATSGYGYSASYGQSGPRKEGRRNDHNSDNSWGSKPVPYHRDARSGHQGYRGGWNGEQNERWRGAPNGNHIGGRQHYYND